MADYKYGGSRSSHSSGFGRGRKSFGDDRDFGGRNRGSRSNRQMFKAVCSKCGKDCEVPFNPTEDKPVYCSDCFEKMGNRDDRRSFDRIRHGDRSSYDDKYKAQLESISAKLDKILSFLQPKEVTEVYSPSGTAVEKPVKKTEIKRTKPTKASKEKAPEVTK